MIAKTNTAAVEVPAAGEPAAEPVNISISNVQAIKDAVIPIARGTIVRLVGENGAGKSTAIEAVASAVTKENRGLKPRDGQMAGRVRLPGVTVTIGSRMSRKSTGEQVVPLVMIEDGSGIEKILNPGVKDPESADERRLEGVLEVIGARLDPEKLRTYLGDELFSEFVKARKIDGKGFVDAVKQVKLFLDAQAREVKTIVTACDGAIAEIGEIPEPVVIEQTAEQLAAQIDLAIIEQRDAIRDSERAREALEVIQSFDAGAVERISQQAADVKAEVDALCAEGETLNREIARLQARLGEVQSDLRVKSAELNGLHVQLTSAQDTASKVEGLRKSVGNVLTVQQIAEIGERVRQLREKHAEAIRLAAQNSTCEQRRAKLAEIRKRRDDGEKLRVSLKQKAAGVSSLLRDALKQVPGWTVNEDLRLCVEHSRGEIPFSELSPGEGAARACLLACKFATYNEGEIPLVGLPQECFEGLDGKNRQLLLDAVKEHGLCILTAECDRDPNVSGMHVEVMS